MAPAVSKYVYGVVRASASAPRGSGIGEAPLQTIVAADAAAIVSDVPEGELQAGRAELMVHARVLEQALEGGAVLPMRFGVVMDDAAAVRRDLLERFADELMPQLAALEGKVELHVRAVYEEQALMTEVVRGSPEIAELRASLQGRSEDATYYERIALGEMVAAAVERAREHDSAQLVDVLAPLALATEVGAGQHERVALNASFLVERDRMDEFDRAVDDLGRRHAGRMRFKYTGPLPAHSFVELSLQA